MNVKCFNDISQYSCIMYIMCTVTLKSVKISLVLWRLCPIFHCDLGFPHITCTGLSYLIETAVDQLLPAGGFNQTGLIQIKAWYSASRCMSWWTGYLTKVDLAPQVGSWSLIFRTNSALSFAFLCAACGREASWLSIRGNALCPLLVSLSTMFWELTSWPHRMILRDLTGEASLFTWHLIITLPVNVNVIVSASLLIFALLFTGNWRWSSTLTRIQRILKQQISSRR